MSLRTCPPVPSPDTGEGEGEGYMRAHHPHLYPLPPKEGEEVIK
jgi:hypothetical protein